MPRLLADTINIVNSTGPYANIYNLKPSAFVKTAINLMLGTAGVMAFLFLLMGGVQWIMSGGDKDAAEKARKKITYALLGLTVTFSSYAILFVIRVLFGINLLQVNITTIPVSAPIPPGSIPWQPPAQIPTQAPGSLL
jgi:hypothetical protein